MMLGKINLRTELLQSYAFVARNFNLVKRYWGWELVWLAYSTATSLSVVFIGQGSTIITGQEDIDTSFFVVYLLIGTLVWRFLSGLFNNISEMIQWERWEGTIEYTLMAPVHRFTQIAGQAGFAILYSLLFTLVIGAAMAAFFSLDFAGANMLGALLVLLAGSISLVSLGVAASILPLLYTERGTQMTHIVEAFLLLISGVYYPIEVLPQWLQAIAKVSPVYYVLEGIRTAILDGTPTVELWPYMVPLLAIGAVGMPAGVWAFRQAEAYAKRTGKLKRVG
jgi:ABC-2 type transport system permease protein